jgi:hypothetical protein
LHSYRCIFYFVLMCAFVFYSACRGHTVFKFKFESNELAICKKDSKIKKGLLFSLS